MPAAGVVTASCTLVLGCSLIAGAHSATCPYVTAVGLPGKYWPDTRAYECNWLQIHCGQCSVLSATVLSCLAVARAHSLPLVRLAIVPALHYCVNPGHELELMTREWAGDPCPGAPCQVPSCIVTPQASSGNCKPIHLQCLSTSCTALIPPHLVLSLRGDARDVPQPDKTVFYLHCSRTQVCWYYKRTLLISKSHTLCGKIQ